MKRGSNLVTVEMIEVGSKKFLGVKVDLPKAPLLLIKNNKIMIGCGYFSRETLEKLEIPACIVTGVKTFKDMLEAKVMYVTAEAKKLGIKEGEKVRNILSRI